MIALHLHELDRLPDEPRRSDPAAAAAVRRGLGPGADSRVRSDLTDEEARVLAHAAFGLMNSTPFIGGEVDRDRCAVLLRAATLAAPSLSPTGSAGTRTYG